MSTSNVKTDTSLYSRLDQALFRVEVFFAVIAGLLILLLMFLAVMNVVFRIKFIGIVFLGYEEIVGQILPAMTILGIAYCQRLGGHIRMDLVVGNLRGRILWGLEIFGVVLTWLIVAALAYGGYIFFYDSISDKNIFELIGILFSDGIAAFFSASSVDSTENINLAKWPAKFIMSFALFLLLLRLTLQLWGYMLAFIYNEYAPIGLPLAEDVATLAQKEAETVSGSSVDDSAVNTSSSNTTKT
ncbi:MAG: TRAP transporter small permease [Pseudomonadota bacterium]